jgi:hypothetical protein
MKKLSPTFLTAVALSLAGFANLGFAERYETVFVYTNDTNAKTHAEGVNYLKSNACISTQSLQVPEGEVAYVFATGAVPRPGSTNQYTGAISNAFVPSLVVDVVGLDSNQTLGDWDPNTAQFPSTDSTGWDVCKNVPSAVQPIAGPAVVRVRIKPKSARQATNNSSTYRWHNSNNGNWDFQASEGYVTFRIIGSEKEVSKKFATVIPENAAGNIDIILEQSTDLINWTAVNPGSFPPSTAKRFFRVRSQE